MTVIALRAVVACSSKEPAPPAPAIPPTPTPEAAPAAAPGVIVTGIRPALGPVGQWVYVFGAGFVAGETTVSVGGGVADGHVYDSTQLGFTVPVGAAGTTPVTITVPAGRATSTRHYTVGIPREPPRIDLITPPEGPGGTWVIATGANFVFGQTTIIVDGLPTRGEVYEPESLWFTVPSDVTRSGPVTVQTPNGTATSTISFRVITAERMPE